MPDDQREAWVNIATQQQVEAARQRLPAQARTYDFGFFPAMGRLIMAHLRIAAHFGPLFREIMFGDGVLSRREREMVASVAASAQDCEY